MFIHISLRRTTKRINKESSRIALRRYARRKFSGKGRHNIWPQLMKDQEFMPMQEVSECPLILPLNRSNTARGSARSTWKPVNADESAAEAGLSNSVPRNLADWRYYGTGEQAIIPAAWSRMNSRLTLGKQTRASLEIALQAAGCVEVRPTTETCVNKFVYFRVCNRLVAI